VHLCTPDSIGVLVWRGAEIAIFRQAAANFQRRSLWVPGSSILPINANKMGDFHFSIRNFVFLDKKNYWTRKIVFTGSSLLDIIPVIYNMARSMISYCEY